MTQRVTLADVAWIDARIVDPTLSHHRDLLHVSAENIAPVTGALTRVRSANEDGMGSGKYLFDAGDVLYSKLRPYLRKAAVAPFDGLCSADMYPLKSDRRRLLPEYLRALLVSAEFTAYANEASGRSRMPKLNREQLFAYEFLLPPIEAQRRKLVRLNAQLAEIETARQAAHAQLHDVARLADAIILASLRDVPIQSRRLGDVLDEVKQGIGKDWALHPVLGATRHGLAPAKELPGKHATKYKPAFPGTVFYNPMRILIGSIAFVDEDDAPGITSPDYVALRGKPGIIDSRWFYCWFRSPLGVQCINSLARGAVRERMLFNRLAEGGIELPSFAVQQKASAALKELKPLRRAFEKRLTELGRLPQRLVAQAFDKN